MKSRSFWMVTLLALSGFLLAAQAQETIGTKWAQYSAHYTETVSTPSSSGNPTHKQTLTDEIRSQDGAVLTVVKIDGKATSGKLWLASGQMFSLDYLTKRAVSQGQSPRQHPSVPPDAPLGTQTIAGIQCVVYPLHMNNGNGTVCVDQQDDILGRIEVHTDSGGVRQDYVKELTWIDLNSPVDSSKLRVPDGFTQLTPSK